MGISYSLIALTWVSEYLYYLCHHLASREGIVMLGVCVCPPSREYHRCFSCLHVLLPSLLCFLMFSFLNFCSHVTVCVCHTALKGNLTWLLVLAALVSTAKVMRCTEVGKSQIESFRQISNHFGKWFKCSCQISNLKSLKNFKSQIFKLQISNQISNLF